MTSELEKLITEQYGDRCPEYDVDCPCCQIWAEYDTRALPDVPELDRYICEHDYDDGTSFWSDDGNHKAPEGEYVLHSQAAKIIAAKDGRITAQVEEIARLNSDIEAMEKRAEAAEAKLAQMEKNEAVAYGIKSSTAMRLVSVYLASDYDEEDLQAVRSDLLIPLYASPAPAADLKAEIDRLREALRFYADTSKYPAPLTGGMGDLWSDCGEVAKKALKGESNV